MTVTLQKYRGPFQASQPVEFQNGRSLLFDQKNSINSSLLDIYNLKPRFHPKWITQARFELDEIMTKVGSIERSSWLLPLGNWYR